MHYGKFAKQHGAIRSDKQGFAIFPTVEAGQKAQDALWHTSTYQNLTIEGGAHRWTQGDPASVQNAYTSALASGAGVSAITRISNLTPAQMQGLEAGQKTQEGWSPGAVVEIRKEPQ
jgi:hypothetical protein